MLGRLARLKTRHAQPLPAEFAFLGASPQSELDQIYSSPKFAALLRHHSTQLLAFQSPPAPFWILQHCPQAVPLAVRSYLRQKDLASAFSALQYLPKPRQSLLGLGLSSLGCCTASVWPLPLSILIAGFWCGLGVTSVLPPHLDYVKWQKSTPASKRNSGVLQLCDHIVAWYEDYIGSTTENWHRIQHSAFSELDLNRQLHQLGVERQPRQQDQEYADYWTHRDEFRWKEPDQDPSFYLKNKPQY